MDNQEKKKLGKKLITHDGSFHADDIFAAATLSLLLEKEGTPFEIIRTRDEEIIKSGDYVFDVGGVDDSGKNLFDHHQPGGAGKRPNGIEYASFGLVWKKFGEIVSGSVESAQILDKKIVSPIDAGDNAISLVEFTNEVKPYFIQSAFNAFYPSWKELNMETLYSGFIECVKIAKEILTREINHAKDILEAKNAVMEIYHNTEEKRIIVLDKKYPYEEILAKFPEPTYIIYPRADGLWAARAERKVLKSFENKKDFPKAWSGLRDQDLQKISRVPDALFCHRGLFLVVAKTREGAIKLAQIALKS